MMSAGLVAVLLLFVLAGAIWLLIGRRLEARGKVVGTYTFGASIGALLAMAILSKAGPIIEFQAGLLQRLLAFFGLQGLAGAWVVIWNALAVLWS